MTHPNTPQTHARARPQPGHHWLLILVMLAGTTQAQISWDAWDALLEAHVNAGQVDYRALGKDTRFTGVVESIASATPAQMQRDQQLAFYINAYNIMAIQGIINGRSPSGKLTRTRYFFIDKYTVGGEKMTLSKLENKKLRSLAEPRIHFAIVCASRSCPLLRAEAYRPDQLERQLEDSTRQFIRDTNRNRFDNRTGIARISLIFKWFKEDFEQDGSLQQYLATYVSDPTTAEQLRNNALKIEYEDYDWSLNGNR